MKPAPITIALISLFSLSACTDEAKQYDTWHGYGGSSEMIRYSTLAEIDTSNVQQLKLAWTYNTRDADTAKHSQIQCNPIIVDGILYGTTPAVKVFALDAATGKEIWRYDPFDSLANRGPATMSVTRGLAYWSDGKDER